MAGYSRRQVCSMLGGLALGGVLGGVCRITGAGVGLADAILPPGAGSEADFLAACIRCGQCVQACPYDTLTLAGLLDGASSGAPYADDLRHRPCRLCRNDDEPLCIAACPTNSLMPVAGWKDIRMGVAVIDTQTCLPYLGRRCHTCWQACPVRDEAIHHDEWGRPFVNEAGCLGCGICEAVCPTRESSIVVKRLPVRTDTNTTAGAGA
ncbi:MAG: 4Fe-4S binding protein [Phycisphaerales bacterium]|nr:4Fe-4S binding protein [Phycisphaerales bacterium]